MNQLLQSKTLTPLIVLAAAVVCIGLLPRAQAVVPAPDGGYPGGNTAEGQNALLSLTTGTYNTAIGIYSLLSLTDGDFCTGVGAGTLLANTGDQNTATGAGALLSNIGGGSNTANGAFALFSNIEGNRNTAIGFHALENNNAGSNTAVGADALGANTTGINNIAVGGSALLSNTTGNGNTALGAAAGGGVTTANNVICIASAGANVSSTCFIGHIRGATTQNANAIPVLIDSAGQLGTMSSSRRFKKEIKPMEQTSEGIHALKPVTFHYKSDTKDTPQFGLIAEEVAEVNPNLVVRDKDGEIYTVRYDAVNAMLLNEFLKEHRKVEEQQKRIDVLAAQLKEQAAQIQKVSAQLEASKPAPQVVNNNQ
jgi:hypothetical protein